MNAVWAAAFIALLLGLLAFAGPTANSAIFSLAIAGQYIAYTIPILSRFLGGRQWTPGPFSLGRFVSPSIACLVVFGHCIDHTLLWQGLPVAIVAVAWMVFSVTILAFPTAPAPNAQGMNYMVVVIGGWIILCLVYYHIPVYGGACWFNGPLVTIEEAERTGIVRAQDEPDTLDGFGKEDNLDGSKE